MQTSQFRQIALCCSVIGCMAVAATAAMAQVAARVESAGPVDLWGQPIERLRPAQPRAEEDADRIKAAALVAHGRILQQQNKDSEALSRYQRAHRYAPRMASVLNDVVALSFRLGRNETAARFAVIAAELEPQDAELTMQLGRYLTEKAEFERAIGLYERAIDLFQKNQEDASAKGQVILLKREIGRLHFLLQQYDKAAESFAPVVEALEKPEAFSLTEEQQKAVRGKPELTYLLFAEAFLEAGRDDAAAAMFRKIDQLKPTPALLAYQLARVDARKGKPADALRKLDEYFAAKLAVGGTKPYRLLGELLEKTAPGQNAEQARLKTIERLVGLHRDDPGNVALAYHLAGLHRQAGKLDQAAEIYRRLLELEPTLDTYQGLIDVYRRQGEVDELLDTLGRAALQTGELEPLGDEGQALIEDKKMVQRLISAARQGQRDKPDELSVGAAYGAGLVAVAAEQFDAATKLFRHAYEKADQQARQRVVMGWGLEMFMADQFAAAAAVFRRALADKVAPDDESGLHFYLAGALEMDGKTSEALTAAEKASQLEKDSARFESRMGWILYHAKRYAEAEKAYLELLKKYDGEFEDPQVRDTLRDARLVLSNLCILRDAMPQAEEWLEQVLDEFPEDVGALNDLGYLWVDQNKHLKRSLKMIEKAAQAEPDNVAYRDSLGWAYFRLGQFDDAVRELKRAAESEDDPDGVILDHLGDAYLEAGAKDKALATWRRALEAFARDEDKEKQRTTREKIKQQESKK